MTKKDPGNNPDTSSGKNDDASRPEPPHHSTVEIPLEKTEVKNAHASGDGSLEKTDEDLLANESSPDSSPF